MKFLHSALFLAVALGLCAMNVSADDSYGGNVGDYDCAIVCKGDGEYCMPMCQKHGKDFDMQCHGYCKYSPNEYNGCYDNCCNKKKENQDYLVVCKAKCEIHINNYEDYSFCMVTCQEYGKDWDQDCYNECNSYKNQYDGCYNSCCDKKKKKVIVKKPDVCQEKCKQDWVQDYDGCCKHCYQHQNTFDMCCYKHCHGYGLFDGCYEDCYWQRNCHKYCGPEYAPNERCKICKPDGLFGKDGYDNCDSWVFVGYEKYDKGSRRMLM